jgi:formiminoglutamase
VAFTPSPARYPTLRKGPVDDPRFLELWTPRAEEADLLLAGVPFDGAVIGRKGCREGPTAIREAMRFLSTSDAERGTDLAGFRVHDLGDVPVSETDVLETHRVVRGHLHAALGRSTPLAVLGGDNSLSFPTFQALVDKYGGRWGVVVLDAHYDLRAWSGQPNSGCSYRRMLEESEGALQPQNLVEIGIRPYANAGVLAGYAREKGVHVVPANAVRSHGMAAVVHRAIASAKKGTDHIFLSVDIDGLDQSIASGCSAPGAGGLSFDEAAALVHSVAAEETTRGMDLVEVAPSLDPTGNTARTAAQLVATFAGAVASRQRPRK